MEQILYECVAGSLMVTSYPCGITKDMGIFSGSLLIKMEN
jgi:hypothetical protein